jgi:hypothetical protein
MNQANIDRLEKKAKRGWAMYYKERDARLEQAQLIIQMTSQFMPRQANGNIERPQDIPVHISREFIEMAIALNKEFTCPCCYELVNKDTIKMPFCGHILCVGCYDKLQQKKCPSCRKAI